MIYFFFSLQKKLKTVEGAKVILSDIIGHNGIIHIIDRFLYPVPNGTLNELLQRTPEVNLFWKLIQKVNLTKYLTGKSNQ